jgi:hypothetical protein
MTEERNQSGAETDVLVSQAYRDIADERTPDHLDRTILRAAAKEARPRYARSIAWTRPMAWAATVMLSVALVLEVTDTPAPGVASFDETTSTFEVRSPEADATDDGPVDLPEESVVPASEISKKQRNDMRQKAAPVAEQEISPQQPAARERAERLPDSADFKIKNENMLQQAEELARMQVGENRQPSPAVSAETEQELEAGRSLASTAAFSAPVADCNEDAVATPQTWLECIVALEDAGRDEAAREQRALLAEAFPDFDPR